MFKTLKNLLITLFIMCSFNVNSQTTVNFGCTGGSQNWTVPPCVTSINVTVAGADGGGALGGNGAVLTATIPVIPGQVIAISVGCSGTSFGGPASGGYGGGGIGFVSNNGNASYNSSGGGGASKITIGGVPYMIAAGGGGAGGGSNNVAGGSGGCSTGTNGASTYGAGGTGGTQISGGTGGTPWSATPPGGSNGGYGFGGMGGFWGTASGGGGGGGYYGGGGGGNDGCCTGANGGGGGGGGSSLIPAGGGCSAGTNNGPGFVSITYTLTVVTASNTGPYCEGDLIQLSNTGIGTYFWTGPNGFTSTLQNPTIPSSTSAMSGVYTITVNGCVSATTTVIVKPKPTVTVPLSATYCNGIMVSASSFTTNPIGGTFTWTNSNTSIGLSASGVGNTPSFTSTNFTGSTISGTITVTPTLNGCIGLPVSYTITVEPTPTVTVSSNSTYCAGDIVPNTSYISSPFGGSFTWTNSNNLIGLASSGIGNIPAFIATNLTNGTISGTITVTPTVNGCVGTPSSYTITVNPTPIATVPLNSTYCDGNIVPISVFNSNVPGTTFTWSNSNTSIGLGASGIGNIPSFTSTNSTGFPISGIITVTPTLNGCIGISSSYTIIVNPIPPAPTALGITICPNNSTTLTATAPGGTYEWYDSPVGGTLLATNPSYTTPTLLVNTTYYVQTTINGCVSTRTPVTVTISPLLVVDAGLNDSICFGGSYTLGVTPNGVGYSYVWNDPSNSTIFNPTVNPSSTTTYTVTVTDQYNCVGSDIVTINVDPELFVIMGSTDITCNGYCNGQTSVVVNGGTTPYNYSWTSGSLTNTATNLCPSTNTVTVTDAFGCVITGNISVIEPTSISINIVSTVDPLCFGNCNGSITVNSSGGFGNLTYSVDGINFQSSGVFNNLCSGNYTITVQDGNLCQNTINSTLIDPALLVLNSVTTTNVSCNGGNNGSITINAIGGTGVLTYSINNGTTYSNNNIFTNLIAGSYNIIIKDANGCTVSGGIINIIEPITLSIFSTVSDVVCYGGNDGWISVAPQGGTSPYTFNWSNGSNIPLASNLIAGNYSLTVTDNHGCSIVSNFTINQPNDIDFAFFVSNPLSGCVPVDITFSNTSDTNLISSLFWDFGDGGSSTIDTVTYTYNTPGVYNAILTVTDTNGCIDSDNIEINIYNLPISSFTTEPAFGTVFDPSINFIDQSQYNITSWYWNFDGLGNSILQNPTYIFPEDTGIYHVILTVTNSDGCIDSTKETITIKGEYGIYMPNAFTPNNDDLNDEFLPKGFGITDKNYTLFIFDRWGEIIFETHENERGWDGTYKGKIVANGSYVWKIVFTDINGRKHTKVGNVFVTR